MGAAGFHGRVRNGVGWGTRAIGHQVGEPPPAAPHRVRGPGEGRAWGSASPGMGMDLRLPLLAGEVVRAIRTGQLHASPRVHTRPIDVVVCHGSSGETWSCGGFPA